MTNDCYGCRECNPEPFLTWDHPKRIDGDATGNLTGGDWERRANEYWDNWHRSARIAGEEQMRAEAAEAEAARLRKHAERLAWILEGGRRAPHFAGPPERRSALDAYHSDYSDHPWDARELRRGMTPDAC